MSCCGDAFSMVTSPCLEPKSRRCRDPQRICGPNNCELVQWMV